MQQLYKYYIALIIWGISISAFSQQSPMYTQYMFNTTSVNPAYAASTQYVKAVLLGRVQWVDIDGAPRTQTLTVHGPIRKEKIGVGLSLINDEIGPTRETGIVGDFAYQIKLNNKSYLSMGLKGGANFYRADLSKVSTDAQNDPAFSEDIKGKFLPVFGFGFYYYSQKYYVGLSSPNLVKNKYDDTYRTQTSDLAKQEQHFYIIGGYAFEINKNLVFKPSGLIKYVKGSPISFDVNASFLLKKRLWLGAAYRFGDAVSLMAEIQVTPKLLLGYSYDYTLSRLSHFNSGTHEVLLSYSFRKFTRSRIKSPRYF